MLMHLNNADGDLQLLRSFLSNNIFLSISLKQNDEGHGFLNDSFESEMRISIHFFPHCKSSFLIITLMIQETF